MMPKVLRWRTIFVRGHRIFRSLEQNSPSSNEPADVAYGENELISTRAAICLLVLIAAVIATIAMLLPPIPQPQWYHMFADQRRFLGIPNFNNVVSNFPFAVVGLWGLVFLLGASCRQDGRPFLDRRERWPYLMVFVGLILTAAGSSYYHLQPDNTSLVWDRLPMAIVFMSLLAAIAAERMSLRAGLWLMPLLLFIGVGSVLQWRASDCAAQGICAFTPPCNSTLSCFC